MTRPFKVSQNKGKPRSPRTFRIIELIHEGKPPTEIAAIVSCHLKDIYDICHRYNLPTNRYPKSRRLKSKGRLIRDTVVSMVESGYTQAEIVRITGLAWPLAKRVYDEEVRYRDGLQGEEAPAVPGPRGDPGPLAPTDDAGH